MSQTETTADIFKQYPPVVSPLEGYQEDALLEAHPSRPMGRVEAAILSGDYVCLPSSASPEEQRDNLDATYARRIQRFIRSFSGAGIGAALIANSEDLSTDFQTPANLGGLALFCGGVIRALAVAEKNPRIDNCSQITRYGSKIRMPGSWLTLAVSKRLYARHRKWQYRNDKIS